MADTDVPDSVFTDDNTQIVTNPTYGVAWRGSNSSDNSNIMDDYQPVSAVNPHYSAVDLSKKIKNRSTTPDELMMEENGIPIPGRRTDEMLNGYSVPKSIDSLPFSVSPYNANINSLPNSFQSCGSPTPLLPPSAGNSSSGVYLSQSSQASDRSSNSEPDKTTQLGYFSEYSYAGRTMATAIPSKNKLVTPRNGRIDEEDEEVVTPFAAGGASSEPSTKENISYLRHFSHDSQKNTLVKGDMIKHPDSTPIFEIIIIMFSVVSIVISVVVILLFIVLVVRHDNNTTTSTGSTTNIDQSLLTENSTSGQCDCPGKWVGLVNLHADVVFVWL